MCGITGIFNPVLIDSVQSLKQVKAMAGAMVHRGPDEDGFYTDDRVVLGHRRLSIIDRVAGQQPMSLPDESLTVVFNGEIYNHGSLRGELEEQGHLFQTRCDTEVLLHGYKAWGADILSRIQGMFAFVIYDKLLNIVFGARDHIGKKPMYFHVDDNKTFRFSSELASLCACGCIGKKISLEGIQFYFQLGYIPAPYSIYKDISKLEAGHAFRYSDKGFEKWQYWDIPLSESPKEPDMPSFLTLLDKAVKSRLESEVPLGAFLSAGIDSNLVVAAVAKKQSINTYTAGFTGKSRLIGVRDEREIAAEAARLYGVRHHEISVTNDVNNLLPELVKFIGEPLADASIIPTYLVCNAAKKYVTVVLTGDGGDEPFGGYSFRYLPHLFELKIRNLIPELLLKPLCLLLAKFWPDNSILPRFLRLKTLWRNLSKSPAEAFFLDQVILRSSKKVFKEKLLQSSSLPLAHMMKLHEKAETQDPLNKALYIDVKLYMCENVLVKADRMSMANSLELRSPLLDKEIVEFAFTLPAGEKISGKTGKFFLRKIARTLAYPGIFTQPKTGFSIPVNHYLRNFWRNDFESKVFNSNGYLEEYFHMPELKKIWNGFLKGNEINLQFLWALYVFCHWHQHFHQSPTRQL